MITYRKGATIRLRLFTLSHGRYLYAMKYLHFICCLCLPGFLFLPQLYAQSEGQTGYNAWEARPGDTFYVYGRMANIRNEAAADAAITDSLPCGTPVIIKAQGETLYALKNMYAPWMKIQYGSGIQTKEGYIWEGLLGLGSYLDNDVRFVYGIERVISGGNPEAENYTPQYWVLRLKVLNTAGQLLDEKEWKTISPETSMASGKLLGNMGLTGVRNIVRIAVGGGACAVPAYYYYYAWTGTELLSLPGKMEESDAGAYYHSETLLFPSETGGQPAKLIRLTEEGEAKEDNGKNGEPVYKVRKSRQVYIWDGRKATLQK